MAKASESYKFSSTDLCKTIGKLAIRIATSHLTCLLPYNSYNLIALDKSLGVQSIGTGKFSGKLLEELLSNI